MLIAVFCALVFASTRARAEKAAEKAPAARETPADDPIAAIPGVPVIPSAGLGGPTAPATRQGKASWGISGSFGGSVLFEKVAEDYYATLDLYNQTRIGPVIFGIWVPLRFRVLDESPENDGVFRNADWDEASDYARILRFVEVNLGGERWRFRGRFGALEGESIGHGTIVAGYFNSLDRNHYQAGLVLDSALRWGGLQFMLDNLLGPEIFAFRLHGRPASFFGDNKWLNRLILGFSVASDTQAPVALVDRNPDDGLPDMDTKGNFAFSEQVGLSVFGFDAEYTLLQNRWVDLVPYLDVNFLLDRQTAAGMHLGTFFNFYVPTSFGPTLLTRLELRVMGDGYAPRYFDTLYEAQRLQYSGADLTDASADSLPLTKLGWLRCSSSTATSSPPGCPSSLLGTSGNYGWLGELYFDFAGWVKIGGTYEDYAGPNNAALTLGVHLPKFPLVQVGAFYARRGFDDLSEAFDLDDALLIAYARVKVYGPVALTAVYSRSWRNIDGVYQADSDFSIGAGLAFSY